MSKREILEKFVKGAEKGKASNLEIRGNELINYSTVIAKREKGRILLNARKYSQTTTRNQNIIRALTPSKLLVECEVI